MLIHTQILLSVVSKKPGANSSLICARIYDLRMSSPRSTLEVLKELSNLSVLKFYFDSQVFLLVTASVVTKLLLSRSPRQQTFNEELGHTY